MKIRSARVLFLPGFMELITEKTFLVRGSRTMPETIEPRRLPSEASAQLVDDHVALDKILKELKAVLARRDVIAGHAKLDLFWARLAAHIRAEHLHLFPAVLSHLENIKGECASAPDLSVAQGLIARLRADHDYFMLGLALLMKTMRELLIVSQAEIINEQIGYVSDTVVEIEQRLIEHNDLEEAQVYRWVKTMLCPADQEDLARQITAELEKRPPRFPANVWSNA
jgi:Hemerythrin HHE cation binding domain